MREMIFKCDGCKKQKGESNHWYSILVRNGTDEGTILISEFREGQGYEHYCGQECIVRRLSILLPKVVKA